MGTWVWFSGLVAKQLNGSVVSCSGRNYLQTKLTLLTSSSTDGFGCKRFRIVVSEVARRTSDQLPEEEEEEAQSDSDVHSFTRPIHKVGWVSRLNFYLLFNFQLSFKYWKMVEELKKKKI